ncbi:TIM barrel protein [Mycoplasmatota bacterium]|nr:TIM barrel protein [Mycoplasmatota bacterium]
MKAKITGFIDHDKNLSVEEQVELANRHKLDTICLRFVQQKNIFEVDDKLVKKMQVLFKDHKIKVSIIDPEIKPYRMDNNHQHEEALDHFKYALKIATKLKATHIYLRLFKFNSVIDEYPNVEKRLNDYIDLANRSNKKIIIYPTSDHKMNTYTYIFKKYKSNLLSIFFDPVHIMNQGQSATTTYRLLKKHISSFACHDANRENVPKLIGYGKADVVALFKKLMRDNYKGFLLIDNQFYKEIFEEEPEKKGLKKLFNRRNKRKETTRTEVSKIIFPNEETKNATYDDILDNQIKLLHMLFK